jgi:hypothetical protein
MMGNGLVEKLVKENKIRVMYYDEFLAKENEEYYARLFEDLYKFCNGVEIKYKRSDFRTYQEQGANLGEIHSIILGMFTGYTLFFSDDKGAKSLADKKINTNAYSLKVKNVMDVLEEIAQMEDKIFTKKDFVNLTKGDKRKERIKGIKDIWVGS